MRTDESPFRDVPALLRQVPQWVLWRSEVNKGRPTKIPYQPSGQKASTTNPRTWCSFDEAVACYQAGGLSGEFEGIGFVFTADDPFLGIDFDKALSEDGQPKPWTRELLGLLHETTYVEISPSGLGLHALVQAKKPEGRCRTPYGDGAVEVYDRKRYFTITGQLLQLNRTAIVEAQDNIERLLHRVFESESKESTVSRSDDGSEAALIEQMIGSQGGGKIAALLRGDISGYPSHSEADLALCSHLWFWTDGDAGRVDRMFRQSGLMRKKWERADYREATISRAARGQFSTRSARPRDSRGTSKTNRSKTSSFEISPDDRPNQKTSHRANACRMAETMGQELRFAQGLGFLVYDGKRWQASETEALRIAARVSQVIGGEIRELQRQARGGESPHLEMRIKKLLSWQRQSENTPTIRQSMQLAAPLLDLGHQRLDAHPTWFNVENGTLDLATSELRPHRAEDFLSKLAPVEYYPEAEAPRWRSFIDQICCGSEKLAQYLQTALGYSITGLVREQCLFFAYGEGQNGKSTLLDALRSTLGSDYLTKAAPNLLIVNPRESSHPSEIADLRGARLVVCQEAPNGKAFDIQKLKEMTGEHTLKTRHLYRDWFEFEVSFKIWLTANHLPRVDEKGSAFWRRLHLIPFAATIEKPIRDFAEKLAEERSGILAWLVEGARRYFEEGLQQPPEVIHAGAAYRQESDSIGLFLNEGCKLGENLEVGATELWIAYKDFTDDNGLRRIPRRALKNEMLRRGFQRPRRSGGFVYQGLQLSPELNDSVSLT